MRISRLQILEGIKVLDITQYLAGPTVGRLMAELGAEVIKIEIAPDGDPSRSLPVSKKGTSGYFVQQNRGKKSVGLDIKKSGSSQIIERLIKQADVFVENLGPGVLEKRKWDWKNARHLNDRLIMASISMYGKTGHLSHKTGYDWAAQAFSGLMHMTGERNGPPTPVGIGIADVGAGVHAFAGIGMALFHRMRTGKGQFIDISMVDALFHMHDLSIQGSSLSKDNWKPKRCGAHHELIAPFGVFKGPTGYLVILSLQRQWPLVCNAMNKPELIEDDRFHDLKSRAQNRDILRNIIESWAKSFRTNDELLKLFESFRVPAAPVLEPAEAINHPYFKSREQVREIRDDALGTFLIPGFPFKFSDQDTPLLNAPYLGQHNREVVIEQLGFSETEFLMFEKDNILISRQNK